MHVLADACQGASKYLFWNIAFTAWTGKVLNYYRNYINFWKVKTKICNNGSHWHFKSIINNSINKGNENIIYALYLQYLLREHFLIKYQVS